MSDGGGLGRRFEGLRGDAGAWFATHAMTASILAAPFLCSACASRADQAKARNGSETADASKERDAGRDSGSPERHATTNTQADASSLCPGASVGAQPEPDAKSAARAFAEAVCQAFRDCGPLANSPAGLTTFNGEPSACSTQIAPLYEAWLAASGSGFTPGGMAACAERFVCLSCSGPDGLTVDWPSNCLPNGTGKTGSSCLFDAQCESGWCSMDYHLLGCGVCQETAKEGESCSVPRCARPLGCGSPTAGAPPTCHYANVEPLPILPVSPLGGACTLELGGTRCTSGAFCDPTTDTCNPLPRAPDDCWAGGACLEATCLYLGGLSGRSICVPNLQLGEPCTVGGLSSTACEPPASCIKGTCQLPDAALCP